MEEIELTGKQYAQLFMPNEVKGNSYDDFKAVSLAVRRQLEMVPDYSGSTRNNRGSFYFSGDYLRSITMVSKAVSGLGTNSEVIRLPETKIERASFGQLLVESSLMGRRRIRFIAPVCPDYEKGERFYQSIGTGVSPEAEAAIKATIIITKDFSEAGFDPIVDIIVANTEDDIPEIMKNTVSGDIDLYKTSCEESVKEINHRLASLGGVRVSTFTYAFGEQFRDYQYLYEGVIRKALGCDQRLKSDVERIGEERKIRHSKILGRPEVDYELTIRYIAQYAALGSIVREQDDYVVLLNYQTPNRLFFNAAQNKSALIRLTERDQFKVVPVLGTIAQR